MDSRAIIKRLQREGWVLIRVRKHYQFKHPNKPGLVTLPHPRHDLPIGTLKSIYQQAGWTDKP